MALCAQATSTDQHTHWQGRQATTHCSHTSPHVPNNAVRPRTPEENIVENLKEHHFDGITNDLAANGKICGLLILSTDLITDAFFQTGIWLYIHQATSSLRPEVRNMIQQR